MVLWSVFELVPRWLHMSIVLLWLFALLFYADAWGKRTGKHLSLILNIILAQLPGLSLSALSFWTIEHGQLNEWMNGGLEMWTSPLLRLWEWLPRASYQGLSAAYLAACLTPYLLVSLQILWYFTAQRFMGKYQWVLH
ncbi:hypothetical protein [Alicyclobacillus sp. SO9]|uniref:hypothetical protein n=1 Tax=Alicyclobacillus sp. SO9 TaxID=2665646 RepID=UPI0018E80CF0|nr:hypothetical protein [Alicyclobacillus sp. SO9]QQE79902.1 hypothetical protein GI364_05310 [Alicyclobacillus sp. SO9]